MIGGFLFLCFFLGVRFIAIASNANEVIPSKVVILKGNLETVQVNASCETVGNIQIVTFEHIESAIEFYKEVKEKYPDIYCEYDSYITPQSSVKIPEKLENKTGIAGLPHQLQYQGGVVEIALLDTGVNGTFQTAYNASQDNENVQDDMGHGTRMAEIILAQNTAELIPVKVVNEEGVGTVSTVLKGLEFARNQSVDIINLSFITTCGIQSVILQEYLAELLDMGIYIVVSAGNENNNVKYYSPTNMKDCIVVGSADCNGEKQGFSNYGETVDFYVESDSTSDAAAMTTALIVKALSEARQPEYVLQNSEMWHVAHWEEQNYPEYYPRDEAGNILWCVYEEWLNYRDTLGGEGAQHYLNKEVPLMHSVGGNKVDHWIIGQVTLVKNKFDHYCYVRIDGNWYVHLQGYKAHDHTSTTGWFAEELVVESSKVQQYQLDIQSILEEQLGGVSDGGGITFDIFLNDEKVGEDLSKYSEVLDQGTTYVVNDIKTSEGYYYSGSPEYSGTVAQNTTVELHADLVRYQIRLDANGGSGTMKNISATFFETIELPRNQYVKEGASFVGWTLNNKNGPIKYEDGAQVQQLGTQNGSEVVLYAKWDQAPTLEVEDVYMYLNQEIDMTRVLKDAKAMDEEDGNIQSKIKVQNKEALLNLIDDKKALALVKDEEHILEIIYEVQDSVGNIVEERALLHLYGIFEKDAYLKQSKGYVRFISKEHMDTLEPNSVWKKTDMYTYLWQVLS